MGGHIPEQLAFSLKERHGITIAIETGTYKAQTTRFLGENFLQVYSIEMDEGWYTRAQEVLADLPNVSLILGDSRDVLAALLPALDAPALFWLDAHWCGGARADQPSAHECPLREELDAIRADGRGHYILIDDARLFTGRPEYPHSPDLWPTWDEVRQILPEKNYAMIHNDVIVSVPRIAKNAVMEWMKNG
jgi:hypothetical protein